MKLKKFFFYLWKGVSWGCTFFVGICLLEAWCGNEVFLQVVMRDFVRQATGAVLAGIACASSAIVYTFERLSAMAQIIIHFTVGLGGYFAVAFWAEWIPLEAGLGPALLFFGIGVFIFAAIWTGFYLYNKKEAQKINAKLHQLEKEP